MVDSGDITLEKKHKKFHLKLMNFLILSFKTPRLQIINQKFHKHEL